MRLILIIKSREMFYVNRILIIINCILHNIISYTFLTLHHFIKTFNKFKYFQKQKVCEFILQSPSHSYSKNIERYKTFEQDYALISQQKQIYKTFDSFIIDLKTVFVLISLFLI